MNGGNNEENSHPPELAAAAALPYLELRIPLAFGVI